MNLDPEFFTVKQSKEMGIWPPGDTIVYGVWPYIKKLKKEKLDILVVGIEKGDLAIHLLETDANNKINKIYGVEQNDKYSDVLKQNIKNEPRLSLDYDGSNADVVVMNSALSNLDELMEKYYEKVNHSGIFCGNDHGNSKVKTALTVFRRTSKIGTPINPSNGCWFWWVR